MKEPTSQLFETSTTGLLSSEEIVQAFGESSSPGTISPFVKDLETKGLSYGLSNHGYDLRLSGKEFFVFHVKLFNRFKQGFPTFVDPKNFNRDFLKSVPLMEDETGMFFILPGYSYGLGVTEEFIKMPSNIKGVSLGKSTYARCGIYVNTPPIEPGWNGYLTLEIANCCPAPCKIYAYEGITQVLFLASNSSAPYGNRKYNNQKKEVTIAKAVV